MKDFLPEIPSSALRRPVTQQRKGFSLIEVAIAISVVAFALVAIIGLLPAGMSIYSQSSMTSASTQIFEKVLADARQTDFNQIVYQGGSPPNAPVTTATVFHQPKLRYFDHLGEEIVPTGTTLSNEEVAKVVYHVNTRIVTNAYLPTDKNPYVGQYLATLTVQVMSNPGNRPLSYDAESMFVPVPGLQLKTLSVQLAKND